MTKTLKLLWTPLDLLGELVWNYWRWLVTAVAVYYLVSFLQWLFTGGVLQSGPAPW